MGRMNVSTAIMSLRAALITSQFLVFNTELSLSL